MARISIYIPDDLKLRMDEVGSDINWSEIARTVFRAALATHEHRKEKTMDTAIERLRASKRQFFEGMCEGGRQLGEAWARDVADYVTLRSLARLDLPSLPYDGDFFDVIRETVSLDPASTAIGESTYKDDWEGSLGDIEVMGGTPELPDLDLIKSDPEYRDNHNSFVRAWAEGAREFYASVKDKI